MNRRLWTLISLLLVVAMLLTACPAPAAQPAPGTTQEEPAAPAAEPATTGPSEMHIAWPYQAPPSGHFNSFVANAINLGGVYINLMYPPLFFYMWADDEWMPLAGQSWEWADETTLHVSLIEGAVWSNGDPFTAQDVVDTFDILRLQNTTVWRFLEDTEVIDDTTVAFYLTEPSTTVLRRILREVGVRPSAIYGEYAQRTRDMVEAGMTSEDADWSTLLQEFNEFRPEETIVLGPYQIDMNSITEAQLTLNKVETSYWADDVQFDRLVNFNGETPDITPLVLAGNVDYATHGFPPATERQFIDQGIRIIRAPLFTGPALYFNHNIYPLNVKEFRQALAYAIDRDENGFISLGESGRRQINMTGFSDNLVANWLTEETQAALNPYDFDRDQASALLEGLGFSRNDQGNWLDDQGNALEFTLTAPAEFADWSAAAENVAQQLTDFGIPTTFRGVNFQQHPVDVRAGDFELAIRDWGTGNPHPHFSYNVNFNSYNRTGGEQAVTVGPGMDFPLVQEVESLGAEVDLAAMTDESALGSDQAVQAEIVNDLALAYNELLPQIPLWERYGNNPVPEIRVTGWPEDGDPVYLNGPGADPFTFVLLITGVLQPVE
jgi:peptide/nickel transport system substrate-binding protein